MWSDILLIHDPYEENLTQAHRALGESAMAKADAMETIHLFRTHARIRTKQARAKRWHSRRAVAGGVCFGLAVCCGSPVAALVLVLAGAVMLMGTRWWMG